MQKPVDRMEYYRRRHWVAIAEITFLPILWYGVWHLLTLFPW